MFWKIVLLATVIIGIAIAGIAIKMFAKKGGEFRKACSSVDPHTGERLGCVCGDGDGGENCVNKEPEKKEGES